MQCVRNPTSIIRTVGIKNCSTLPYEQVCLHIIFNSIETPWKQAGAKKLTIKGPTTGIRRFIEKIHYQP